jgi:hypothetical protein
MCDEYDDLKCTSWLEIVMLAARQDRYEGSTGHDVTLAGSSKTGVVLRDRRETTCL